MKEINRGIFPAEDIHLVLIQIIISAIVAGKGAPVTPLFLRHPPLDPAFPPF